MRNTKEYPLTTSEVLDSLHDIWVEEFNKQRLGSMRPLILSKVRHFIEANEEDFKKFLIDVE